MNDQPAYWGILPALVRYADISPYAKLLYVELSALSRKEGYAFASNQYFADLYKVTTRAITKWLGELSVLGVVRVEVDKGKGNFRKVWLVGTAMEPGCVTYGTTVPYPSRTTVPHNSTSLNRNNEKNESASLLPQDLPEKTPTAEKPPKKEKDHEAIKLRTARIAELLANYPGQPFLTQKLKNLLHAKLRAKALDYVAMLAGVVHYRRYMAARDPQYTKDAYNFFHEECWRKDWRALMPKTNGHQFSPRGETRQQPRMSALDEAARQQREEAERYAR